MTFPPTTVGTLAPAEMSPQPAGSAPKRIEVRVRAAASVWPTRSQLLLLRAALWSGDAARAAWRDWQEAENLRDLDLGSWKLLPLAWRNQTRLGATDPLLDECRGYHRFHWAQNQARLRLACAWVAEQQAHGVPVVALKGVALAADVYGDAGVRPMDDVDFLVPPDRLDEVADRLQAQGWRPEYPEPEPRWAEVVRHERPSFNWRRGRDRLDLHWHVLSRAPREEITRLFREGARPLALPGLRLAQLRPEDALLHVIDHGMQYAPHPPFRWLADAWWILHRHGGDGFDWNRVGRLAGLSGSALAVREGLEFAAAGLRLPVPPAVAAAFRARRPPWRERLEHRRRMRADEGGRWMRAWNLVRLLRRAAGDGPWLWRWARIERFLCRRWETPTLRHAATLGVRKIVTGYRGTRLQPHDQAAGE